MPYPFPVLHHFMPGLNNLIEPRLLLARSYLNLLQGSNGVQCLVQFIVELMQDHVDRQG